MSDHTLGKENRVPMNARAVKLLRAASEMVGGDKALAQRLGIGEALLSRCMAGQDELPDRVLLGTVDIILANHESQGSIIRRRAVQPAQESGPDA